MDADTFELVELLNGEAVENSILRVSILTELSQQSLGAVRGLQFLHGNFIRDALRPVRKILLSLIALNKENRAADSWSMAAATPG